MLSIDGYSFEVLRLYPHHKTPHVKLSGVDAAGWAISETALESDDPSFFCHDSGGHGEWTSEWTKVGKEPGQG